MSEINILETYLAMLKIEKGMLELDNKASLVAALGTAIDGWSAAKGEDPIAVANLLNAKVIEINTTYGKMGSNNNH